MKKNLLAFIRTVAVVLCPFAGIPIAQAYTHPGAPLSIADLDTIKANLNVEPWKSGYAALASDYRSQLGYGKQGPFATVSRSPNVNLNQWRNDMTAIWNLSRMWYFTGDTAYAQKARDILLAWANTQTSFDGGEAGLDLGDYACKFVGGADILRGTWPGWTDGDTTLVKTYFGTVLLPRVYNRGSHYGAANKGALHMVAAGLMAIFNDDETMLQNVLYQYRTLPHIGLRNSNAIGMLGDTGRDQGHAHGQLISLAMLAEALWKQGIDVYSETDNRLLAAGEYFARVNCLVPTPFLPFGTTDQYYVTDWSNKGWTNGLTTLNLIHGAYVVRKGLKAPWVDQRRQALRVDGENFMFLKSADPSTATPPAAISFPSTASLTTGMSNVQIGSATPAGSASCSGGIWTVQGAGSGIWGSADSCHFTYKSVTGDFAIVAKVESVTPPTGASTQAGVMVRGSLTSGTSRAWMAMTAALNLHQNIQGLSVYGGTNYSNKSFSQSQSTYWVKLERFGNIITGYFSPDGTN